jgi:hypothetical protein
METMNDLYIFCKVCEIHEAEAKKNSNSGIIPVSNGIHVDSSLKNKTYQQSSRTEGP